MDEPTIISYKPQILFNTLPTDLYVFNLLGDTLQTLSAYYKVYMSRPTHRDVEVLHGLPTANHTNAKDEKYKSPTQEMISSNKIWHQDQQNEELSS